MRIDKDLDVSADFPPATYAQWRAMVENELKGVPFDKKLVDRTFEGIDIQPLYTAEQAAGTGDPSGFPGFVPLSRGGRLLGNAVSGWDIRQEHLHPDPAEANRAILDDLQHGVSSIQLRFDAAGCAGLDGDAREATSLCGRDGVMVFSLGDLARALDGVRLDIAPVSIDAGAAFLPAAALLAAHLRASGVAASEFRGAFNADPLGALMREGSLPVSLDRALGQMADLAAWTATNFPNATAVEIGTGTYHHAGATSTQDLAFAIGTALEYLRAMTRAGLDVDTAARQVAFGVSIGTQFFRAIAKLRALRLLWAKVVLACGGSEQAAGAARIRARTSRRVLTVFDPWVNLLRNTVCCFAGAVAGADTITAAPLDAAIGLSDDFGRRLARNTQIILQEESHLNRVIDPAGGSWFLETLTNQLAEKAWELFQQVEEQGGMTVAAPSGWVAAQIAAVQTARDRDYATRKLAITGISEHPDVREERVRRPAPDLNLLRNEAAGRLVAWRRDHHFSEPLATLGEVAGDSGRQPGALTAAAVASAESGATLGQLQAALTRGTPSESARVEPLVVHTYAAAYEELRAASEIHAERTGARPRVFLANLGTPAEYVARATYATNFFEAGGFEAGPDDGFDDSHAVAEAFAATGTKIAVICSTDKKYEDLVESVAPRLKAAGARTVILAGNPGPNESRYRSAGVDRFIYIRCDVLGTLRDLLREEGVLPL